MARCVAKFIQYDDTEIPVGGELCVDNNLYATLIGIIAPADDLDDGELEVRWAWGSADRIPPIRARGYITREP